MLVCWMRSQLCVMWPWTPPMKKYVMWPWTPPVKILCDVTLDSSSNSQGQLEDMLPQICSTPTKVAASASTRNLVHLVIWRPSPSLSISSNVHMWHRQALEKVAECVQGIGSYVGCRAHNQDQIDSNILCTCSGPKRLRAAALTVWL